MPREHRLSPLTQPSGFFFCFCRPRHAVDGDFQVNAFFGRGRCDRRDKSSGPPLLKPSLNVKWNTAHSQSSASWPPRSQRPQRARSFKGPLQMELSLRRQGLRQWNGPWRKTPRRSRRQGLLRWMVRGKQSLVSRQRPAETTERGAWVPTRRFYEQSP
jgi:hypothetical protein